MWTFFDGDFDAAKDGTLRGLPTEEVRFLRCDDQQRAAPSTWPHDLNFVVVVLDRMSEEISNSLLECFTYLQDVDQLNNTDTHLRYIDHSRRY